MSTQWQRDLGPVRLEVEHRRAGGDRGGTLRVRELPDGPERLRFDCFEDGPHFHYDPAGRDEISRLDPLADPVSWTADELRNDLEGYLKRAGLELGGPLDRTEVAGALGEAEAQLRCPPPDLDGFDVDTLRHRTGEKWRRYPDDVLAAWVADMDFPVAEPIQRAFRDIVRRGDFGYPVNPAVDGIPTLFAERMQERYAWKVEPRLVEVMTDVVQAVFVALHAYVGPDEGAVIQTPIYPPFLGAIRATGRRAVENPLARSAERYEVDLENLRDVVDDGTRILLLCNPHNPSGRVLFRAELEGLAQVALERDLIVVSDEIHADLVYGGQRHTPFATLGPEVEARTVTLTSATKAFNVAGMRCSVTAFGSRELKRRFMGACGGRHAWGGKSTAGMAALEAAWRHSQPWLDQVLAYLEGNRDFLVRFVAERMPGVVCLAPEATYLAWLDCAALGLDDPHRFFLERAKVGLSNGADFGPPGRGAVRVNFATSRAILTQILERMAGALESR